MKKNALFQLEDKSIIVSKFISPPSYYYSEVLPCEKKKFFIGIQDVEHELEMIGSSGSSHQSGISYSFQRDTENVQIFHVDVSIPQSLP